MKKIIVMDLLLCDSAKFANKPSQPTADALAK